MKKAIQTEKSWNLVDAKGKILGRLASYVAKMLSGKNSVSYARNLDRGDFVVIINAKNIIVSGKKETQKNYFRHSGYPGGLKSKTTAQIRAKSPETLIRHAVVGMLPKNRLGKEMARKLFVYSDSTHPYQEKFKSN